MHSNGDRQFVPGIQKVAIVFDDQTRPETTGVYCRRALERVQGSGFGVQETDRVRGSGFRVQEMEVHFFHPSGLAEVPRSGFHLYLNIDDGMRYLWPADLRPAAWWAIDTHIDFAWSLEKARGFDLVFAAQRDGAALLRQEGIVSAEWLPLACDPEVHGREPVTGHREQGGGNKKKRRKKYDVCFVGNLFPGPRSELVRLIQQRFKNVFVGQAYFAEMAEIYARSKIVFNRSLANDVNMRVFEALASGSLLLTNDLADNGQAELFRDGVHLATYRDSSELLDKLEYYLRRDDVRERIAAAGRDEVLAKHTYRLRMEVILRAQGIGNREQEREAASKAAPAALTPALSRREREHVRLAPTVAESEREYSAPSIQNPKSKIQNSVPYYYDFLRPEVLEQVPTSARRVLEVGCGTGRLGEALKKRQACEVVGVELHGPAADKAASRLNRVVVGDVERIGLDFAEKTFDCLICADVLEHLVDPAGFLRIVRRWLTDDATIVASIPNVRHHSVMGSLIEGNWTYEPAGLLDNTHLHFFTRRDTVELFAKAGYEIEKMQFVPGPGYDEWQQQPDKSQVQVGRAWLTGVPYEEAQESFVYQFLIVARRVAEVVRLPAGSNGDARTISRADRPHPSPSPEGEGALAKTQGEKPKTRDVESRADRPHPSPPPEGEGVQKTHPRCLLLMVTFNRLEYTRLALEAVLNLDYQNLRIVVWDNASTDGTVAYLHERLAGVPHAKLIASPANRGVVFPMNEVWSSDPDAELLAKIDNDTLVPPELLRRLAECHRTSKQFGVLSGFHFRQEGEALADAHRIKSFDGVRVLPQPYVGGCAVMIRREVFKRVGPIGCRTDCLQQRPFMDSGWTVYQQRLTEQGFINGYPWPPIHVDHMEDTRSPHCIRSEEHQRYKREERGMGLEEFTKELCVWRPNWETRVAEIVRLPAPSNRDGGAISSADRPHPSPLPEGEGERGPHPSPLVEGEGVMRFRQDFTSDFDQFDLWGKPFAFARFADGELAICLGTPIQGQDGWLFDGRQTKFARQLNEALRYDGPGYFIGISDGCCDRPAKEWYLQQLRVPLERITFSNIFVNANYQRFQKIDTSEMVAVASEGGDFWVPEDLMNSNFDLDILVERLLAVDRPILVSAGPASCIIIHKYWRRAVKKQVIVDVGSAIDERTKGRKTRQYQVPGTRTSDLRCNW